MLIVGAEITGAEGRVGVLITGGWVKTGAV